MDCFETVGSLMLMENCVAIWWKALDVTVSPTRGSTNVSHKDPAIVNFTIALKNVSHADPGKCDLSIYAI